jgi:hypothetical protein
MTVDEAYRLILWSIALIVVLPSAWVLWDVLRHRD